jgi:hypothetical protein
MFEIQTSIYIKHIMEELLMETPNNLKQLQQRVHLYYHQDGLVDILFGLGLIGFALMMQTGNVIYNILGWICSLAFYLQAKKAITIPRLGFIQFQLKHTRKWGLISLVVGSILLVLFLGLTILIRNERLPASAQAVLRTYDMLIIGSLLSIPLTIVSALTGLRRPLGYIVLILLVILVGIQLGIQPPFYIIALGVIIILVGTFLLGRFLIRYPTRQPSPQNDN